MCMPIEVYFDYMSQAIAEEFRAPAPEPICETALAYEYLSDSDTCNDIWRDWDYFCAKNWTVECDWAQKNIANWIKLDAPTEECFTQDAREYFSDSDVCNEAW